MALISILVIGVSGCTVYEALFNVLGSQYSEGGLSDFEKRRHFEDRVEAWQGYEPD